MALLELSMIIETILSVPIEGVLNEAQHHDVVLKVRRKLAGKLPDPEPTFASVYQHTLIEYGIGKHRPLLEFFKYEFVQDTFRVAYPKREWQIVEREIDAFLETHNAGEELRQLGIDLPLEIRRFAALFAAMVERTQSPAELIRNQTLSEIAARLQQLPTREDLSAELAHIPTPRRSIWTATTNTFISYARRDGREFAHTLREKLEGEGFPIWQDVVSEIPGEGWWPNILAAIEGSSVMVLVFTKAALQSHVVRDEWLHARKIGTFIVPVIPHEEYFRALGEEGHALIPRWLDQRHVLVLDEKAADYHKHWQRLLQILRDPPPRKPVPFAVPCLPDEFVHRHDVERRILDRLLDDDGLSPRAGRTALVGTGGFGKTTLAQAVCSTPEVIEAFKDGVLWLELGEEANEATVTQKLNEAVEALGGVSANTQSEASRRLADLLRERDCLIILDDIWQGYLIESFLTDAEDSERPYKGRRAWLLTAREPAEVSRYLTEAAGLIEVGEMETSEAAELLAKYVTNDIYPLSTSQLDELAALATQLGEWPLLIVLSGYELRQELVLEAAFEKALIWLREGLEEEGFTTFDRGSDTDPAKWRHQALSANVALSLRRFSSDETQRLLELSIFPSDSNIPTSAVYRLWEKTSESAPLSSRRVQKLLRRFNGPFLRFDLATETIHFHDVMRSYLEELLGKDAHRAAHNALLAAYNPKGQPWHTIDDRGYLYSFLAYHLHEAGREDELQALFADQNWMHARVVRDGYTYTGYLQDLNVAWEQVAYRTALKQINAGNEPTTLADCVRYSLIHTSINSLAGNFVPELVARAVEAGEWSADRALAIARQIADKQKRRQLYLLLLQTHRLTSPEEQIAQQNALETSLAMAIKGMEENHLRVLRPFQVSHATIRPRNPYEASQAKMMAELIPHLKGKWRICALRRGLEGVQEIADGYWQATAIAALVPYLSGEQRTDILRQGLEAALRSEGGWIDPYNMPMPELDEIWRPKALTMLAPYLEEDLLRQGLEAVLAVDNDEVRSKALAALVPYLKGEQRADVVRQGLETAFGISDEKRRTRALVALASHLEGDFLRQALDAALMIADERRRAETLEALAPRLKGDLFCQALEATLLIADEKGRAKVLAALAPHFDAEQFRLVLKTVSSIFDGWSKIHILAALAPHLKGDLFRQALEAALAIAEEQWRAKAVAVLAPYLKGDLQRRALEGALTIKNETFLVEVLITVFPYLEGELRLQGLRVATTVTYDKGRAQALTALAPHLCDDIPSHMLLAAQGITDPWWRLSALTGMIPYLTGKQRIKAVRQALEAVVAMNREDELTRGLETLAPHLEDDLLHQALSAVLTIEARFLRERALVALAPHLKGELLRQGLDISQTGHDGWAQAASLAVLVPNVTGKVRVNAMELALAAILTMKPDEARVRGLESLAPHLDANLLRQALKAVEEITSEKARAQALAALAPHLVGELLQKGIGVAQAISDGYWQSIAIAAFVTRLTGEEQTSVLHQGMRAALENTMGTWDVGEQWSAEYWRAEALKVFAPFLNGDLLHQALEAALVFSGEEERARALEGLAPFLVGDLVHQALKATMEIEGWWLRKKVLVALAPHLKGDLLYQVLVDTVPRVGHWSQDVVEAVVPHLSGVQRADVLRQQLDAALAIHNDSSQAEILVALAPYLEGDLLCQALKAALAITPEVEQVKVLTALAPQLDTEVWIDVSHRVLEAAQSISDGAERAQALTKLIPHLSDEQRADALRQGLKATLETIESEKQLETLTTITHYLGVELGIDGLRYAQEATLSIKSANVRAQSLGALLKSFNDTSAEATFLAPYVRTSIADALRSLSITTREEVLYFCGNQKLFSPPCFSTVTLTAVARNIIEICTEWVWL